MWKKYAPWLGLMVGLWASAATAQGIAPNISNIPVPANVDVFNLDLAGVKA